MVVTACLIWGGFESYDKAITCCCSDRVTCWCHCTRACCRRSWFQDLFLFLFVHCFCVHGGKESLFLFISTTVLFTSNIKCEMHSHYIDAPSVDFVFIMMTITLDILNVLMFSLKLSFCRLFSWALVFQVSTNAEHLLAEFAFTFVWLESDVHKRPNSHSNYQINTVTVMSTVFSGFFKHSLWPFYQIATF